MLCNCQIEIRRVERRYWRCVDRFPYVRPSGTCRGGESINRVGRIGWSEPEWLLDRSGGGSCFVVLSSVPDRRWKEERKKSSLFLFL